MLNYYYKVVSPFADPRPLIIRYCPQLLPICRKAKRSNQKLHVAGDNFEPIQISIWVGHHCRELRYAL